MHGHKSGERVVVVTDNLQEMATTANFLYLCSIQEEQVLRFQCW